MYLARRLFRIVLSVYRFFLSVIFRKSTVAIMPNGVQCDISRFEYEINHGDIVHPCIRYTEKSFKGYNWWMVYTPYYGADATMENPILCYGVFEGDIAPVNWKVYSQIVGKPDCGYNSDPTMFFDEKGLNIFWRENETPRTEKDKFCRATYGCVISENDRFDFENPILTEECSFSDREVSPTIMKDDDNYTTYAMHLRFVNPSLHSSNTNIEKVLSLIYSILSILEIYNEQKSFGIAIWKSNSLQKSFKYIKTVKIINCNRLYRPWHLDIFDYENKRYAVIQTTQCNADICLAVSEDNENFTMYSNPLITNVSIGKLGIYKPTAFVYNGIFSLYYTAQDSDNRALNKLYCTYLPIEELFSKLKDS